MPTCPSPYVYMDGDSLIQFYDPGQPLSATNPGTLNIPTINNGNNNGLSGGLTLMPNINGGTLSPTFYTTKNSTFWYWDGVTWVNTFHNIGDPQANNLGGCNGKIYSFEGGGDVYVYDGTGNATYLTYLAGFAGGGPWDLVTDCNCNFYSLKTSMPNQALKVYSPTGVPLCTYSLINMPNAFTGGGLAIVGDKLFLKNNTPQPGGFYVGTINGLTITFTAVPNFTNNPGDFASCPICSSLPATISNATIGCSSGTTSLAVSSTLSPLTYSWTGPGIAGPANDSIVSVNSPGVYTCTISYAGCPPSELTLTTSVVPNYLLVTPTISPSGTVCLSSNDTLTFSVAHSLTADSVFWTGPGNFQVTGSDSIIVSAPGTYTVRTTETNSGCEMYDYVTVKVPPQVNLILSNNTLCAQPFNGSNNTIVLTGAGAKNYTLNTPANVLNLNPGGPLMPLIPVAPFSNMPVISSVTLIGSDGVCTGSSSATFTILPNPSVFVTPSISVCEGNTFTQSVSGADNFSWTPALPNFTAYNSGGTIVFQPTTNTALFVYGERLGCRSDSIMFMVNINKLPEIEVESASICLYGKAALTAKSDGTSFSWWPPIGLSDIVGKTVTASPPQTQTYVVTASLNTCTRSATATVSVQSLPVPAIHTKNAEVCLNETISLSGSGGVNYEWRGPKDQYYEGQHISVTARMPEYAGIYTLTVEDKNKCRSSTTIKLTIHDLPFGTLQGKKEGCAPMCENFKSIQQPKVVASWAINNQTQLKDFKYCFPSPGVYTVSGHISSELTGCENRVEEFIIVHPKPDADFYYSPSTPVEKIDEVIFENASTTNDLIDWKWIVKTHDETREFAQKNVRHVFEQQGIYPVVLTVSNKWNCKDTIIRNIKIESDLSVYIPNVFTPNGDDKNNSFLPVTRGVKKCEMRIYDRWGHEVFFGEDLNTGWDGTFRGIICQENVYTYNIKVRTWSDETREYWGHVTLIR